jgi:hypothetical protein
MKHHKIIILSLVTLVLFLVFTGCASSATTAPATISTTATATISTTATTTTTAKPVSPFTDQQLQQIATDATAAMNGVTVYKMTMDVSTSVSTDGAPASTQAVTGNIALDQVQKQMTMDANMTIDDGKGTKETQAISLYILTDLVYIKASVPNIGETWVKTSATPEVLNTFDAGVADEIMPILKSPASVEWVGSASVNNVDCYILKIVPNETYLKDYAQGLSTDTIDWTKVGNVNNLFKEIWYQVAIAKDTKLVNQIKFSSIMQLTKDMVASGASKFNKMVTDTEGTIGMYDFNTPLVIKLPDAAKNAIEIPPEVLTGK